jgi:hypothetical protein
LKFCRILLFGATALGRTFLDHMFSLSRTVLDAVLNVYLIPMIIVSAGVALPRI